MCWMEDITFQRSCTRVSVFPENKPKQTAQAGVMVEQKLRIISVSTCGCCNVFTLTCHCCCIMCVCLCVCAKGYECVLHDREKGTGGDEMCPSSLCNYLPIFSPSAAFIIPFRSHLGVADCHSVAPPSLNVRWMKCRSPPIDLCLPAPASLSPYLFPRNRRHLEIRIIINQRSQQLFMQPLKRRQRMGVCVCVHVPLRLRLCWIVLREGGSASGRGGRDCMDAPTVRSMNGPCCWGGPPKSSTRDKKNVSVSHLSTLSGGGGGCRHKKNRKRKKKKKGKSTK